MDVQEIAARYAAGLFPMDDPEAAELPWWAADPRAIFELDERSLAMIERRAKRSLRAAEPSWTLTTDAHFDRIIEQCGRPRGEEDGVWLTPRMHEMYRQLNGVGLAHTFELVDRSDDRLVEGSHGEPPEEEGELLAGIVGVTIGRAAMLESMCHWRPHAGNVLLVRTLRALKGAGCELCDLQMLTPHTERLGATLISREEYERRLNAALSPRAAESAR
jgi:leucyl/phenylalanyl-tRNA--protein transferase